jgi:ribosomal protein L7/L12
MTLVAALQMVESAPVAVREDIYEGDATAIVTVLRDAGATVELRPTKRSA